MNESIVAQLQEAQQAEALLRLQRDLGIALSSTSDLDRTLHEVLKTALQIEGIDCGGVYLVDECRGDLYLAAHQGISPQFVEIVARYSAASPRGQRVLAGLTLYRGFHDFDVSQDEILQREGLRAVAVIPVKNEGQVVAALNLASRTREEIMPGARDAVEAIAAQIGGVVARVRMEAALRQSQRNLEAMFDALDDMVFVIGLNGRIIHANSQVRMRLGYSLPEIVGQPVTDLHPPDRRQEAADIFARLLAGQTSLCPVPVVAKDGTLSEVETRISRGEWDGRPVLFGISRDMSERIRTEQLLRTENAFREAVIDGVAEGLCVCRDISEFPNLRFTVWNHRMTEITGYTLEQINRWGWYETLYPDEGRREAIRADAAALQEGREYRGAEWVITRADGERRTLLVWTSRLDTGRHPKHLLALVQDVTENKRLQQALRDSQDELAAVLAAVTDHITMLDEEHNIVWSNGVAERLFGSDLVGRKCHRVFHGRDEPCENCLVRRTFASGRPQEHETRVLTLEGERAFWCTSSVAARDDDGRPRLVIEVSRDITDRQRAEELSRKHLAELARVARLATMGEMVSGLAHEINQPLTAVASYAGACFHTLDKSPSPPKEQLRDLLNRIEQQAVRAGKIVHRLRSFVVDRSPTRVACNLNELVSHVLELMESELKHNRVSVNLDLDQSLPDVSADPIQIEQVVLNLVKNAADAVFESGNGKRDVTITTAASDRGQVELAVSDSGAGVPAENRDRVFDAFFTTKPDGMGMGLAISRSLVEAHGGRLWLTPNSARGCTFRFTVPAGGEA